MITTEVGYKGEFTESGHVQVCKVTRFVEDGKVLSSSNHRYVLSPGDDYTKQPDIIKNVCAAIHTQDCIDKYNLDKQKRESEIKTISKGE